MLEGLVQHDFPLNLQHVLGRMRSQFGDSEVQPRVTSGTSNTNRAPFGVAAS